MEQKRIAVTGSDRLIEAIKGCEMGWHGPRFIVRSPGISSWWIGGGALGGSDSIVLATLALTRPSRVLPRPSRIGAPISVAASIKILDKTVFLEAQIPFGFSGGREPMNPQSITYRIETRAWEGTSGNPDVEFGTLTFQFRGEAIE